MKKTVQIIQYLVFGLLLLSVVSGETVHTVVVRDTEEEEWPRIFDIRDYNDSWILGDTNGDGRPDYALKLDDRGEKKWEAVDHNHDGMMDNFYQYRNGVLHRQELDTNHDGSIDLWIYMHDGVRVQGYRRDTNHDGVADLIRDFSDA